jgi:hypothetical protein
MHLDEWAALVPGAKTRGVLDSSYFFAPNGSYPFLIREAFEFHQSVATAACLAANQNATWRCAYPKVWDNGRDVPGQRTPLPLPLLLRAVTDRALEQHLVPYVRTPFIMLQPKFDTFQMPYLTNSRYPSRQSGKP